jgi:UDP-N-acetylmuramate--alanine ligase
MSGLAQLLVKNGAVVSGSDETATEVTARLCRAGANIRIGHAAENLNPATETVVISAAIREDNPELAAARAKGIEVLKYAQMLGELFDQYSGIAVAGTHGKSTTSGWLVYCMRLAGFDPNFIVGADIAQLGLSSGVGESKHFVAEACEYDRSFLNLHPQIACILNVEPDHLDYYRDLDDIIKAYADFACNCRAGGTVIVNGEDENLGGLIGRLSHEISCQTFGIDRTCNWRAEIIGEKEGLFEYEVYYNETALGRARNSLPGLHNVYNGLAVVAMAVNAGLEPQAALKVLPEFTGMDRRLMLKAQLKNVTVLDDYAHHPTEIRASLEAIRRRYNPNKLWCVFQPHQYSRTRFLLDDFAESFTLADVTIVPEIYFVRDSEQMKQQVNAQMLVDRIVAQGPQATFIDGFSAICDYLKDNVAAGDAVVTMGAGDVWKVADGYIQWLRRDS